MKKTAVHITLRYFEFSENWIHTQIKYLKGWNRLVLTNKTKNLNTVNWQPAIYERQSALSAGLRELDSLLMKCLGYYPSFYLRTKKAEANLVHAHFGPMGFLGLGIAQKLNIPLVTTFYGYDASELPKQKPAWRQKYKKLFGEGNLFLVEGPAMKQKLMQLGCPPQKIRIQRLGIELDDYPIRASYHQNKKIRVLMAGRFVEKKGFIYGIKAFHTFLKNGGEGGLTIIGDSSKTESSERIKQQMKAFVSRHKLDKQIHFKGLLPLDELKKEYYNHDIFLAPSTEAANGDDEGGLPVTAIEAAAAGLALIGSRHCDIPEVIQPNKTGFLANEKDANQFAGHLTTLYRNPELRKQLGVKAAQLVHQDYSAEKQGEKLATHYNRLIS